MASVLPEESLCAPKRMRKIVNGAVLLCAVSLSSQTAWADPNAPQGSITYIREVPVRHAYLPGEPGDVHYVKTDPSEHVFGALQGLTPLSDAEAAGIFAETHGARDHAVGALPEALNLALMGETQASRSSAGSMNSGLGHTISDSLGGATSALAGALGVLGSSVGGE